MSKSTHLRSQDWRAILRLTGECRELGDDRDTWRRHFLAQLCGLVAADLGFCPEMAGFRAARPTDLGVTVWGFENGFNRAVQGELRDLVERDPTIYGATLAYFQRLARDDGVCHSRQEIIADREWYHSTSYQVVHRSLGLDHILWCFRSLSNGEGDEFAGVMLERAIGRRGFSARDRSIVREAQAALGPLIGGPLARFAEPSPTDLAPRARQVLGCLLQGDGDKQIAAQLKLSIYTVNQYIKVIFRHFGVSSRPELLARWVRRGYGGRSPWMH
jgi:DNA-binding CsgD family transcriptional regulator